MSDQMKSELETLTEKATHAPMTIEEAKRLDYLRKEQEREANVRKFERGLAI